MYLKEIRAHGFKSFADDIKIELSKGTNGIVGPNGSGKSNIVDAVRWVLGEQSVKSLRGDNSMTDVIFSGSKSRNAAGSASVTLVFDNKDRYLKIDNDTISIKRKLYNDGTNEFYLNNEKCRLKDVVDILLDSGIAKESFNIISQGKIEEILSTKPTDRRIIFEEAAGVLKYKKRKEDALRKLDKTHDNMTRAEAAAIFARNIAERKGENISSRKSSFKDVSSKDWFNNYIAYLEKYKVISGYDDKTFKPDEHITRAEFVTMCMRFYALDAKTVAAKKNIFNDVPKSHWASGYIYSAVGMGWINGYSDSTFKPDSNITRAEVVTIVNRVTGRAADTEYINKNMSAVNKFTDLKDKSYWAFYEILEASNTHNTVDGKSGETWVK